MNLIKKLKKDFNESSDLIVKQLDNIYVIYLESICDSDKINFYILQNIPQSKNNKDNIISGPNTTILNDYNDIKFYLINGFSIVISNKIYAVETRGNLIRGVEKPDAEPAVYGPKDAFNENIQMNLGLIKRRIKTEKLINDDFFIGKYTKTKVSVLYIDDIADKKIVNIIKNKLKNISIDSIISIGNIKQLLGKENRSTLPTIQESERPDTASYALMEGKIVIICDNSPFVLILPAFFNDFINPVVDNYSKSININFLKILRFFCLIYTIFAPAFYIALINYNIETIPLSLMINIAMQRDGVPFPSYIECIIMLILCGILKESDMRFPSSYGSSISIVGALILGEAAVSAGLISPIMIIITASTFITSLIFTDQELVNGLRYYRFIILLLSSFLGLLGFNIGLLIFLIHISGMKVLGKTYTFPISPFSKIYFKKILFKSSIRNNSKRDPNISKNIIKGQNT